jgi:hypothetical protein
LTEAFPSMIAEACRRLADESRERQLATGGGTRHLLPFSVREPGSDDGAHLLTSLATSSADCLGLWPSEQPVERTQIIEAKTEGDARAQVESQHRVDVEVISIEEKTAGEPVK